MTDATSENHRLALRVAVVCLLALAALFASNAYGADELAGSNSSEAPDPMTRGEYMTALLGCAGCHTEGALEGNPYGPPLAGSQIGIAYTDSQDGTSPGLVFPGNLTPDKATGLGNWSRDEIVSAIRSGVSHSQERLSSVMPWANYALLTIEDTYEIAGYLQSLAGTRREIPASVAKGSANTSPYIRIGIYRFEPAKNLQSTKANH